MAKKFNTDEIDESLIISAVKKNRNAEPENIQQKTVQMPGQQEAPKEESRRKRAKVQDYESLFIRESTVTARLGKTVYIRKEFHDRILKIVQVIGGNEISLFSYIDNVLAHHFENFQDDITEAYNQKNSSIF